MARRSKSSLPPLPDVGPARKPSRFWLYAPFGLAGLAAAAWTGFWFYASGETAKQMDLAADRFRAAGYEIAWSKRSIDGYPFRLDVTLEDARLREPSGWGLTTPRLEAEAYMHALSHWVFATPRGLAFVRPVGGPVEVKGKILHASLHDADRLPPSFSFEGVGLSFAPAPGARPFALTSAERVEFHLRPGPDAQGAVLFKLDGGQARLSGLFARMAEGKPISMLWDSLITRTGGFRGRDWAEAARAWSQGGGQIQVRQAGLTAGDALVGARSGTLGVDADGRLTGSIDLSLRQAPRALNAMAETGTITSEAALAAAAVAQARQDQPDLARASLTFQAGRTTLGPAALGPAPKVF